jgi:multiple sugar transport system substrate-binding protein
MLTRRVSRRDALRMAGSGVLGLSGLSVLAGCGSGGSGSDDAATLSFVYLGTAEQQKQWNDLFAQFRKEHSEIALKATGVPVDNWAAFFDKVNTQIGGGVTYDIVQIATEGRELFAANGLLAPLDDYIKQDQSTIDEFLKDVHPNLIKWNKETGSPDGKTYYLPGDFNTMVMWVNAKTLNKAGVDVPTDDWTWDDFYAAGQQVKKRSGAFLYPATAEYFIGVMPWLTTNGASTMSADWKTATCDTPQAVEAAEFCRKLVKDKLSPPPGGTFDRFTLAVQGKLAMFGGGRWPIVNIRQQKAVGAFELVAWPHKGADRGSPVGWAGYPIFKSSANKDDVWTFVKFLISAKGEEFFATEGGTIVPARKSIASSDAFLANAPKGSEKLYEALEYATPIPSPPKNNLIQRSIEDVWGQILNGNTDPAAGMKKMQAQVSANV